MTDTKVSVIIPTYNRCRSVERILRALTSQSFPFQYFEVIVSVDGSTDSTQDMVATFKSDFKLIHIWQPKSGRAAACNRGIQSAIGDIIILLDDDMEPSPQLIEAHYNSHLGNSHLGIIGAAPINLNEYTPPHIHYIGSKFNTHLEKISSPNYNFTIRDFYSGNFSIRREVLLEVGVFNEAFEIYGNEDLELAWRFLKNGIKLTYSANAYCTQHYEKDFTALTRDTIAKGTTAVLLAKMHPETYTYLRISKYDQVSWKWRSIRSFLLKSSLLFPSIKSLIILLSKLIEKAHPSYLDTYYFLSLDYFFWLGVEIVLNEDKKNGCKKDKIPHRTN